MEKSLHQFRKAKHKIVDQGAPDVESVEILKITDQCYLAKVHMKSKYCTFGEFTNGKNSIFIKATKGALNLLNGFRIDDYTSVFIPRLKGYELHSLGADKWTIHACYIKIK